MSYIFLLCFYFLATLTHLPEQDFSLKGKWSCNFLIGKNHVLVVFIIKLKKHGKLTRMAILLCNQMLILVVEFCYHSTVCHQSPHAAIWCSDGYNRNKLHCFQLQNRFYLSICNDKWFIPLHWFSKEIFGLSITKFEIKSGTASGYYEIFSPNLAILLVNLENKIHTLLMSFVYQSTSTFYMFMLAVSMLSYLSF